MAGDLRAFIDGIKNTPQQCWNVQLIISLLVISSAGWPKGYDEGGFSAVVSQPTFKNLYGLNAQQWKSDPGALVNLNAWITSLAVMGAAFGALISVLINDRLGRKRSWQSYMAFWACGVFLQLFGSGYRALLLVGRFWAGLGAGGLTVVGPVWLSEVAPTTIRGMCTSLYLTCVLFALMLGFFINYAALQTLTGDKQFQVVIGVQLIPTAIAMVASQFYAVESPRWLLSVGRIDEAEQNMVRLRGLPIDHPYVASEMQAIKEAIADINGKTTLTRSIVRLFTVPTNRKRIILVLWMHVMSQWTGGNGITYVIKDIFQYAGVQSNNTALITSGAYGAVKLFVSIIFALFLIDTFGRRKCAFAGLGFQLLAHAYLATFLGVTKDQSKLELSTGANKRASDGAVAMIFVYAIGWSMGFCTIPYIYGSEVFSIDTRSAGASLSMAVHWFMQFSVVRLAPNLLHSLNVYGAFIFWGCVCFAGIVTLFFMMPETNNISLEEMDVLFTSPLWRCGLSRHSKPTNRAGISQDFARGNGKEDDDDSSSIEKRIDGI